MTLPDLMVTAIGLSMDAFAVAICKGLSLKEFRLRNAALVGLWFGLFQAIMPAVGYGAGSLFADKIAQYDHWIAFALLVFIGAKMIKESLDKDCCTEEDPAIALRFGVMLTLAVATSIDALAVGVSFAFLSVNIGLSIALIGVTTFLFSILGFLIGNTFGARFKSKAELLGGILLILMGTKILLEHLGLLRI